jgi:hypothetical protein
MLADDAIRKAARIQGLKTKRNNLIAASLSGLVLACVSVALVPHSASSIEGLIFGLAAGLIYANGFEYCLHRFLLHAGRGVFSQQHMVHHTTLQSPEAARYVNFSSNPWGVVALFIANAIPFLAFQFVFPNSWVPGVFVSFALYYMAFEEIHWRSHMGGRLPQWLRPAARHHLLHHAHDTDRFNVFLPIFDWMFRPGSHEPSHELIKKTNR